MTGHTGERCEREYCMCQKREWRHGDFLNRVEHEYAVANHLSPVEAARRRINDLYGWLLTT